MFSLEKAKDNSHYANLLYLLAFSCYLINVFINQTMLSKLESNVVLKTILFIIIIICLTIKILFVDRLTYLELIAFAIVICLMLSISFKSGNRQLITLIALILGAKNVNFRYVLFLYLTLVSTLLLFVFLFSLADIIPNLQYTRIREGSIKIRNSFGTIYPTVFAAYLLALIVAYSYFIKVNKIYNHIFLILFSAFGIFVALEYADARMSAYSIILYIIVYYFCLIFFRKISQKKIWIYLITFCYPICFGLIFYLSYHYNVENELSEFINISLSGRLRLGQEALLNYHIPFLGQEIKFVGLGGSVQEMSDNYNYVDSSFLQFLIKYGLVFSTISTLSMMWLTFTRLKLNDYRFIAVIFIISLNSIVEDRLLDISINIYWVMILAYYYNFRKIECIR